MRNKSVHLSCTFGLAVCALLPPVPRPSVAQERTPAPRRAERLSDAEIATLIARLGGVDYADREAATAELRTRQEARAAVKRALAAGASPEVARRLDDVARRLDHEWARRRLDRLPEYVKRRQFDRLVETVVACREHLTKEHDAPVRALIKDVCEAAVPADNAWVPRKAWSGFETLAWHNRLGVSESLTPSLVSRVGEPMGRGMAVVAADRITAPDPRQPGPRALYECVALCNGDVEVTGMVGGFLLASGRVEVIGLVCNAVVVSLQGVDASAVDKAVIVSRGRAPLSNDRDSIVMENAVGFFRDWQMFSAGDCGGHCRSLFGVVWVGEVIPGSPFERSGLRSGDWINRVDGVPVRTARDAYRLLCRAAVSEGVARVSYSRDGREGSGDVTLAAW